MSDELAVDFEPALAAERQLSRRQTRALKGLMLKGTIAGAAREAHVSARYIRKWIKSDELFQNALETARGVVLQGCLNELCVGAVEATACLRKSIKDPKVSATQTRSADAVLKHALALRENVELGRRLKEIEAALGSDGEYR